MNLVCQRLLLKIFHALYLKENGWYFKEKPAKNSKSAEYAPEDSVLGHLYEL